MHTPELAPNRAEALLRGAPPETSPEALVERLVRELRSGAPAASPALRERVRAIGERPVRARRQVRINVKAVALTGAAALVVVLGGYGLAQVDGSGGGDGGATAAFQADGGAGEALESGGADALVAPPATVPQHTSAQGAPMRTSLPPASDRARDVDMALELRLADADAVSEAAAEAMGIVDRLGGHVVASAVQSRGNEGNARLSLSVPVGRLSDAVLRLSSLGTITSQDVQIEDLQARVDSGETRIEALERAIRRQELRLGSGTLTREERLEAELRLETLRARLLSLRRERSGLLRRAASAEITLSLHTRSAASGGDEDEGGLAGTARDAWNVVAGAGAVALFALIVLSPLLLLGLLAWLVVRARGRRIEQRLLDEPGPARPQ